MPRKSPVHYIAPSAFGITPNCNGSENDLDVYLARGARIKVYAPESGIDLSNADFQEWPLAGRNRRLADSSKPYTIYARLPKASRTAAGYLVFAPKSLSGGVWKDKYAYPSRSGMVRPEGSSEDASYWYVRMGDVSLPEGGLRTVSFDTGILGTDQYNSEWWLDPDELRRITLACTVDGEDAGPTPYVYWGKQLVLTATYNGGWEDDSSVRFDHWRISRNTGDATADASWPDASRARSFAETGIITLPHTRDGVDDFNGAVSTVLKVEAWGLTADATSVLMASASVSVMAETIEKYELSLSTVIVSYNPKAKTYSPDGGVQVRVRATDQRGDVFRLTRLQFETARLALDYAPAGTEDRTPLTLEQTDPSEAALAVLPIEAFASQQGQEVRLTDASGKELAVSTVAFVRDGEDSREREWIFYPSPSAVSFGDASSDHPLPSLVAAGEVSPHGRAEGRDADKDQDDWVPEGWYDDSQGTDEENLYEYGSYRDFVHADPSDPASGDGHWGEFTTPRIWSHFGEDAVVYDIVPSVSVITASTLGVVTTGAITVKAYRTDGTVRSDNILPPWEAPEGGEYYYAEYSIDGGRWIPCGATGEGYGIPAEDVATTQEYVTLRLKHSTAPDVVLKEGVPISVVRTMTDEDLGEKYLSKSHDDEAHGVIGFLKGVWFGVRDWFIDEGGNGVLHNLRVANILDAVKGYVDDLRSHDFSSGLLDGSGWRITADNGEGGSEMEVDFLKVRKKATFMELEIRKETYVGGNMNYTPAGSVIYRVDYMTEDGEMLGYSVMKVPFLLKRFAFLARVFNYAARKRVRRKLTPGEWGRVHHFRCYLLADDGTTATRNWWQVGDQPRCQSFNKAASSQAKRSSTYDAHSTAMEDPAPAMQKYNYGTDPIETAYYWRLVTNTGSETLEDGHVYDFVDMPYERWPGYSDTDRRSFCDYGSGVPVAGDHIVCVGNRFNESRMKMVSLKTVADDIEGENAPSIMGYRGIHTFSLENTKVFEVSPRQVLFRSKDFKFFDDSGYEFPVPLERGEWTLGQRYHWYDRVSWAGSIWLCQVLDAYVWENASGTRYETGDVEDITVGEGNFQYRVSGLPGMEGDEVYTGTDHYYRTGRAGGQDVYYIKLYTYSEPSKANNLWMQEVDKGRNGMDGDGVEYVYVRTANSTAPVITNSSDTYGGKTYLDDDYLPLSSAGRCTDDPAGPTQALPFEWVAKRTKRDPDPETGVRVWNKYGEGDYEGRMALWATYTESSIRLDLSNEMDMIQTDSAGKIVSARQVTTTARLFDGAQEVTLVPRSLTVSGGQLTPTKQQSGSGVLLTWSFMKGVSFGAAWEVSIGYTYKGAEYKAVFTLAPSMGQAIWQLKPSMSSIPFQRSADNTLTPASRAVGLKLVKIDGDSTSEYSSAQTGLTVRYAFDAMPASASAGTGWTSGDITVASDKASLHVALFNASGVLLDRETVPVVKDGENGRNAIRLDLSNEMDSVLTDSGNGITAGRTVETVVSLYDGTTQVDVSSALFSPTGGPASSVATFTQSASGRGKILSWAFKAGATMADAYEIGITYTYKGVTYKASFSVTASKGNAVYQLNPDRSSLSFARTAAGGYSPESITLGLSITEIQNTGASSLTPAQYGRTYIRYSTSAMPASKTDGTAWPTSGVAVSGSSSISDVHIALFDSGGTLIDRETVPVVRDGKDGGDGKAGHVGRWYYYAGEWDQNTDYKFEATKAPYVSVTKNGTSNYYMLDCAGWPDTQQSSSTYTSRGENPESSSYDDGEPWSPMTAVFKYIITEAIFTNNGKLGSFYVNNDWLISTNGTPSGKTYADFDAEKFAKYISGQISSYNGFIPNFAVDSRTGKTYQGDAYIDGKVVAKSGYIGSLEIRDNGLVYNNGDTVTSVTPGGIWLHGNNLLMEDNDGDGIAKIKTGIAKKITLVTSSSQTLSKADSIVFCNYDGDMTLSLPRYPEEGQELWIRNLTTGGKVKVQRHSSTSHKIQSYDNKNPHEDFEITGTDSQKWYHAVYYSSTWFF